MVSMGKHALGTSRRARCPNLRSPRSRQRLRGPGKQLRRRTRATTLRRTSARLGSSTCSSPCTAWMECAYGTPSPRRHSVSWPPVHGYLSSRVWTTWTSVCCGWAPTPPASPGHTRMPRPSRSTIGRRASTFLKRAQQAPGGEGAPLEGPCMYSRASPPGTWTSWSSLHITRKARLRMGSRSPPFSSSPGRNSSQRTNSSSRTFS
mmetsp:Transcript_11436/g.32905  ORF Transcript_11436/g.32905 Transcript_11436/m.32905 type:complete len:205 (+) Transcript_11436:846-1460(+)